MAFGSLVIQWLSGARVFGGGGRCQGRAVIVRGAWVYFFFVGRVLFGFVLCNNFGCLWSGLVVMCCF